MDQREQTTKLMRGGMSANGEEFLAWYGGLHDSEGGSDAEKEEGGPAARAL